MPLLLLTCSTFLTHTLSFDLSHCCLYHDVTNTVNRKELIAKYEAELEAKRTK